MSDPALADCDDRDPLVGPSDRRLVEAGWFVRGEDTPDEHYFQDAEPIRDIYLSRFCIDVREVTNTQFVAFMEAMRADGLKSNTDVDGNLLFDFLDSDDLIAERILDTNPYSVSEGFEDHPVTEVWPWSGEAFCHWKGGRLPTEAEWEKAARGGVDDRHYPWGDDEPSCDRGNVYLGIETEPKVPECNEITVEVGLYPESTAYGLFDMAGNVAEWVSDWYQPDYYEVSPDTDPTGPDDGWIEMSDGSPFEARVTRGGNFASSVTSVTVSSRYIEPVDGSSNGVGFRCAYEL